MEILVEAGQNVLLVWSGQIDAEEMKQLAEKLQQKVGSAGKVAVENAERLKMAGHAASSFDRALSGVVGAPPTHEDALLAEVLGLLRPGGELLMRDARGEAAARRLTLAGYTGAAARAELGGYCCARKPDFEVGSSAPLKLNLPTSAPPAAAAVWTLSGQDALDDDLDLVDEDELLDEEDKLKPDPASLRVCGTTGKRKACKDCSCGLAEELSAGKQPVTKSVTSSCGSCYLGDAFRCASCPYLGMPAFKPGEKIQLSQRQLNADA
ncbi:Anamorsin [Amphibalanus amphitrite]|uniref:Anamorsin homolog n=1 Tax=Amphibalanus amphitrite TaxID=1232801 RepID=A0A6A4WAL7_AMPAM|nr:Anamorsin [Amphibalanus amphitrite]KAF0299982.1 Anamorsin [Amphibalanus amphitrite]